jgi:hypothetical protein
MIGEGDCGAVGGMKINNFLSNIKVNREVLRIYSRVTYVM